MKWEEKKNEIVHLIDYKIKKQVKFLSLNNSPEYQLCRQNCKDSKNHCLHLIVF